MADSKNEINKSHLYAYEYVCIPYIRFSRIISKIHEVHEKMKYANRTINQCGVTVLERILHRYVYSTQLIFLSEESVVFSKMYVPIMKKSRDCDVSWPPFML